MTLASMPLSVWLLLRAEQPWGVFTMTHAPYE